MRLGVPSGLEVQRHARLHVFGSVAQRHAVSRGTPAAPAQDDRIGSSYQAARAVKEKFAAMTAKLDYERAIGKRLVGSGGYGTAYNLAYVLRTANSWAGPIGDFRLTLDKGAKENIISLCAEGVEKTGPTTFEIRKTDFTPDRDLDILIAHFRNNYGFEVAE